MGGTQPALEAPNQLVRHLGSLGGCHHAFGRHSISLEGGKPAWEAVRQLERHVLSQHVRHSGNLEGSQTAWKAATWLRRRLDSL